MAEWSCSGLQIRLRRFDSDLSLHLNKKVNKIRKAIIPVAGLGTRMLPATKAIPKELLPIVNKPLIQYVVEEAIKAGITEIILITRSGKEAIENHFDSNFELEKRLELVNKKKILRTIKNVLPKNIKIISIRQEDALGLGHAILCAENLIKNEIFAVLLPDEFIISDSNTNDLKRMKDLCLKNNNGQILVEKAPKRDISKYGVIDIKNKKIKINGRNIIKGTVEKPIEKKIPSSYRIIGRYILPPEIIKFLKKEKKDRHGEIQLTPAIDKLINNTNIQIEAVLSNSKVYDCGSKKGFLGANIAVAFKDKILKNYLKEEILK